jgi:perosamine synthetase
VAAGWFIVVSTDSKYRLHNGTVPAISTVYMPDDTTATIPWARPCFYGGELDAISRAISSEWISGGPCILELESKAAGICGVKHAFAVCNGTAAIHLLYLARGYTSGDEIILPSFGYHAAANIALQAGLTPVFADVLPDTWCLDPEEVARLRTPRTRAVMAVQTYGNVCEMRALQELCARHGIDLLEDAAESFGSSYEGVMSGALGLAGTLSFHATKAITTGEGGMVLTDDDALADRVGLYRSHGMRRQKRHYWHELPGNNFRLTNFQAAMGCAQIAHFQWVCEERVAILGHYKEILGGMPGLTFQAFTPGSCVVPWSMPVLLDPARTKSRDELLTLMLEQGVECRPGFYTPEQLGYFGAPKQAVSDHLARNIINLPMFNGMTQEQIQRAAGTLLRLAPL